MVRALNVGGAPPTASLTYLSSIFSTTSFKDGVTLDSLDADKDGKLDLKEFGKAVGK